MSEEFRNQFGLTTVEMDAELSLRLAAKKEYISNTPNRYGYPVADDHPLRMSCEVDMCHEKADLRREHHALIAYKHETVKREAELKLYEPSDPRWWDIIGMRASAMIAMIFFRISEDDPFEDWKHNGFTTGEVREDDEGGIFGECGVDIELLPHKGPEVQSCS